MEEGNFLRRFPLVVKVSYGNPRTNTEKGKAQVTTQLIG